jgi:glutathione S-transferase
MSGIYRLFGSEMSPYSVKVRSYCRYKSIPHEWVPRSPANESEYRAIAKLPIVPTLLTPGGQGVQDSTPIIEMLEGHFPEPSIHPPGAALAFLSALIEEFGDEWGNKIMFHYRWWDEIDQRASAQTLARLMQPKAPQSDIVNLADMIRTRMTGRGYFVGSSATTAPLIEDYFHTLLDLLSAHLADRRYLFGDRPSFGDFGLAAQLYEASVDPTCGGVIRARGSLVLDWCYRMNEPRLDGAFESWDTLAPTLEPLIQYIGRTFLPWSTANAKALAEGAEEFTVTIDGQAYNQQPQKYHAKSLAALRARYSHVAQDAHLAAILKNTGCLTYLV